MARNAEKAMTTLARWRAAQLAEQGKGVQERRPFLASNCHNLRKCEKWRMQVIREIAKKVAQIQNAGLGEFRIRDLNDEINKLLREKGHWEDRIKELGGPDYGKVGPKMLDQEGREVPGNRGYKYFGAAKDLPGVRELFEQEPPPPPRRTRAEVMRDIDADYYGYRDDDDGLLVPLEQEQERVAVAQAVREWKMLKRAAMEGDKAAAKEAKKGDKDEEDIYAVEPESDEEMEDEPAAESAEEQARFIAHVPVPSQKEVEEALVRRKKLELLEKYASDVLQQESEDVKQMLGLQ
ncbi:pre-mRNA-splicing factor ISY1 homolog [Ixodes scapularis]|uniref:pre-mRNA-splicing factor ISY1 homolog n=1 Tax=Ixodes scapularis TaxID=6945 RepID=UPI001A9E6913|nr:pre-mRNA-splicing factor ISY1 homolog [Ixodes scapularis]